MLLYTNVNLMDKSISIIILLFILSLISERFINWLKLCFFKKNNRFLWWTYSLKFDYSTKSNNEQIEKIRERKIIGLNIVCSSIISLLIGANFFEIIKGQTPYESLTPIFELDFSIKDKGGFKAYLKFLLGSIVTGLFMSMGSKFWHDTLDMLFAMKKIRQKAFDPNSYKAENIQQLEEYVETSNYEIVKLAFDENEKMIINKAGVNGCGIEFDNLKKQYVIVVYQDKSRPYDKITQPLKFKLRHGQIINIPVVIFEAKRAEVQNTLKTNFDIWNGSFLNNAGSIGCFLTDEDNNKYLLTCYHCVLEKNQPNFTFSKNLHRKVFSSKMGDREIGQINKAVINDSIDAAIIKINPDISIDNHYNKIQIPKVLCIFDEGSKMNNKKVYVRGIKSSFDGAQVTGINYSINFDYTKLSKSYSDKHNIKNLIGISYKNKPVTEPGDSGCPVFDKQDFSLIGIVIGADDQKSYVIPVDRIINYFCKNGLELKLLKN